MNRCHTFDRSADAQPLPAVPLWLIVSEIDLYHPQPEITACLRFYPKPPVERAKHED